MHTKSKYFYLINLGTYVLHKVCKKVRLPVTWNFYPLEICPRESQIAKLPSLFLMNAACTNDDRLLDKGFNYKKMEKEYYCQRNEK